LTSEKDLSKTPKAFQYAFRFLIATLKNHPSSQKVLLESGLHEAIYKLTQEKFKDKQIPLLAIELVENLSNHKQANDPEIQKFLQSKVDDKKSKMKALAL
jgi:hypothetical protein